MVAVYRLLLLLVPCLGLAQEQLNVAVTASFKPVLETLADPFTESTNIQLSLSSASSGVLYQQIVSGAPFDVFFAADAERPRLLVDRLQLPVNARRDYAMGQLVLVINNTALSGITDLKDYSGRVILANPAHAPYGLAAQQVLDRVGFQGERVLANNVTQARQYLSLGLADVGLIAASVAQGFDDVVELDRTEYDAIRQQLVIVKPSDRVDALIRFLDTPFAKDIIQQQGYRLPESP